MNQLKYLWSNLSASFWFLPTLIVAFSTVLAVGMIEVDSAGNRDWMADWPRLFGAGAAGARGMLATIAGSMTTVVGVTFSMTLVALTLASSQYTSRVLRNFMSDRVTQVVLGIFAGIFTYCIIVLRTIRGGDEGGFVPSLAVAISVVLAIGGIATLIFFIHHIASSIQASSIIASVTKETLEAVDRLFPEELGQEPVDDEADLPQLPTRNWQTIMAGRSGYLQSVDLSALLRLAREQQTIVRMERGIGEFVVENTPLASLALESPPDKEISATLRNAYSIDRYRTVRQDCAFGVRQLVDMALRALSPGINDTTTAVTCVDYLTAILARLASREIPPSRRYENGELRVISIGQTFASLVAESFDQIRGSAGGNVAVMVRMLDALQTISSLIDSTSRWRVLREQVECIAELAERTIESPHDRTRFESRLALVREALDTKHFDPQPKNPIKP
ncbi:MAG: DUF2254 domain-containing protein [Luteolibacter sp.]